MSGVRAPEQFSSCAFVESELPGALRGARTAPHLTAPPQTSPFTTPLMAQAIYGRVSVLLLCTFCVGRLVSSIKFVACAARVYESCAARVLCWAAVLLRTPSCGRDTQLCNYIIFLHDPLRRRRSAGSPLSTAARKDMTQPRLVVNVFVTPPHRKTQLSAPYHYRINYYETIFCMSAGNNPGCVAGRRLRPSVLLSPAGHGGRGAFTHAVGRTGHARISYEGELPPRRMASRQQQTPPAPAGNSKRSSVAVVMRGWVSSTSTYIRAETLRGDRSPASTADGQGVPRRQNRDRRITVHPHNRFPIQPRHRFADNSSLAGEVMSGRFREASHIISELAFACRTTDLKPLGVGRPWPLSRYTPRGEVTRRQPDTLSGPALASERPSAPRHKALLGSSRPSAMSICNSCFDKREFEASVLWARMFLYGASILLHNGPRLPQTTAPYPNTPRWGDAASALAQNG
ncbi:hypothetical protein E2C01_000281 [Portunus trituberculatus]|uniref:Uncharacterized protein n=1 Tax=Portunus trituberculatus TaxID=210409 RepID=A0A5B7CGU2_PORTR|nr:hypothetical protein [Portunus trituberculatus]